MKVKSVDLYSEFDKKRPENAKGTLTCYIPYRTEEINEDRALPAVLIIPGGGYMMVSDREAEPIALRYLAKGFAVFILDYAVAPCKFPTALSEAAMAMLYIRDNAKSLSVDKRKVSALGFSAGGHLCGCLGNLFDHEVISDAFKGREMEVRPDAVILSYPVITSGEKAHQGSFDNLCREDNELRSKLSLEKCVKKTSSPAFIWHTFEDPAVPVKNSLLLALAYEDKGVEFSLHIFEKGGHGLSTADCAAYRTDNLPKVSTGLEKWIDMSIDWLKDRGIKIED